MTATAEDESDRRGFFDERRVNRGLVASVVMHVVGIGLSGLYLSDAKEFEENQEAIPIEVVTQAELNQVTRGDKTAAPAPTPQTKAEHQAETDFSPPKPVERPAERDLPPPPPPPPIRDVPEPPQRAALAPPPEPPPRPPEPKVEPKPPEPKPPEPVAAPQPPRRPPEPVREAKAEPVPEKAEPTPPTPPPRPRAEPRREPPRPDQLAKLIEDKREPDKPAPTRSADPDAIRKLISQERTQDRNNERNAERAQQRAATARDNARQAALGTATARSEKMSPSMWGQLDGYLQEQYRACWNKFGFDGQSYIPQIRVLFNADGSLAAEPSLVNPPSDVSEKALAASAMRAVRRCDPIRIPPQYAPYHAQWKARTLRFDPQEM